MRILFCADIHVNPDHLGSFLAAVEEHAPDAAVVGGDIVPHGRRLPGAAVIELYRGYLSDVLVPRVKDFRRRNMAPLFLDLGNDDMLAGREVLERWDGELFHLLHERKHALSPDLDILGYMCVPFTPFAWKDWERPDSDDAPLPYPDRAVRWDGYRTGSGRCEEVRLTPASGVSIEADLARLGERITGPFVLVSHTPPVGTPLDMLASGEHVGSAAVRRFIERWAADGRLTASFHGHIHESRDVSGEACAAFGKVFSCNPGQRACEFCYVLWEDGKAKAFPA